MPLRKVEWRVRAHADGRIAELWIDKCWAPYFCSAERMERFLAALRDRSEVLWVRWFDEQDKCVKEELL